MIRPKLKKRLGDLLVEERIITEAQLMEALGQQKQTGRKLGATLISNGAISEQQLLTFLAQQLNVPFVDISQKRVDPEIVKLLPEVHARRHRALVIEASNEEATVGMSDPADLNALDALYPLLAPRDLKIVAVRESQLLEAFDGLYRRTADIESFAHQLEEEYDESADFDLGELTFDDGDEDEATVGKLLHTIFEDAVQARASDIHIEPDERQLRIRMRVDGVLQENLLNETRIAAALVLRLKLMSSLDISEKRLPQDGRFNVKVRGKSIDVRISTMPIQHGESVVMRLLDQSGGVLTLDQTGMPEELLFRFRNVIKRPHGMVLVTGPTGSGKTTTLYGALNELNQAAKKIITVEDPVEYRLPRINQVQVIPKIDLTFSNVLRTALRQDPDIIMVGEMRDHETVEIGLRGALTGHLVLSTLHTNDAISSAIRLIDMNAPGYLVASSLRAIVAQRLIRKVCTKCATPHPLEPSETTWLSQIAKQDISDVQFVKGNGCQSCNYVGYRGRIGVFEILELNEAMMNALKRDDTEDFSKQARLSPYYKPLAAAALEYAKQGVTTVEEVLRLVENLAELESESV
ncbi:Flp pilus assembly complex ATPase component TadA [Catenovulum sp. SM1970]|uniref:GspE/PulE family protein n=1 Tax=Marinifaba aquimaris TaxID=2741323 RepID=UPI0015716A56|nr:GspE/PulE family protein [Marinifaba aquimaris]NTS75862.1 Flp pilus assembly complex ATPase component TadA [Marinifaba aquimaris]